MKIRSINELQDALDQEFQWRRRELTTFKFIFKKSEGRKNEIEALCRAGIPMLYGHYEGFIKQAGRFYSEYLSRQRRNIEKFKGSIITLSLRNKIQDISVKHNPEELIKLIDDIREGKKQLYINKEKAIDTKSNLKPDIFKGIVLLLGLDYKQFELYEKTLLNDILEKRNNIAHGKYLDVKENDFIEMYSKIMIILTTFKNEIENKAQMKEYFV